MRQSRLSRQIMGELVMGEQVRLLRPVIGGLVIGGLVRMLSPVMGGLVMGGKVRLLTPVMGGIGDEVADDRTLCKEDVEEGSSNKIWIENLGLYTHDHTILLSNRKWLTDSIIYAAQCLLKRKGEGKIDGWRSTQCSKRKELFPPLATGAQYIQILIVDEYTGS